MMSTNANASGTLLRYDLMTDPFPLQASPETGNLNAAQLTVVASNPAPLTPVTLQGLIITLPVGPDSTALTQDAKGIGPVPPAGWTLKETQYPAGAVRYLFYPGKGERGVRGAGLSFIFNNVEVNRQPGTVEIQVLEGSRDCMPPDCPVQSLYITKFPSGWGEVQLWTNPDPPVVPRDGSVTLNWAGPGGATYRLQYYTPRDGIVIVPQPGQPPLANRGKYPPDGDTPLQLDQTTTFYMSVEESIDKQKYSAQQQVTATVEALVPVFKLFTGQFLWADNSYALSLKWDTQNAATCRLTGDPHLLAPSSLDDSYLIEPTRKRPLRHTYALTAENVVGETLSPPATLRWGNTIASGRPGGTGIAISGDDSYLYLIGGPNGVAKFALDSFFTGSPQPVAQYQASPPPGGFPSPDDMNLGTPIGLALSPDNSLLFVVDRNGGIFVINAETLQLITSGAPGLMPTAVACPRDGSRIYIGGSLPGVGWSGITAFTFDGNFLNLNEPSMFNTNVPATIAISPLDGRIFASHHSPDQIAVWESTADPNVPLHQVGALQGVPFPPQGIAFSPDGTRIFVAGDGNLIHVFDYATLQPAGQPVTLNINATAIASTFDGTRLLVSDGQTLSLIVPSGLTGGVGG
jgi:DNA-binding beta-propeller fold protein YncE